MTYFTHYRSPLGVLTIASDGIHITGLWMEGQKFYCSTLDATASEDPTIPVIRDTVQWLNRYFSGIAEPADHIPLRPAGTSFQQQVWNALRQIPYGETLTYGQVAVWLGKSCTAAQAVGNAVRRNPISILIPCHRVVGANGAMTGYAGGIDRKMFLLELEKGKR